MSIPPNNDKKRLCWNCEGYISQKSSHCLYCGVDLSQNHEDPISFYNPSLEKETSTIGNSSSFQDSFSFSSKNFQSPTEGVFSINNVEESTESSQEKNPSTAFALLLPGMALCIFGLALLLFSKNGSLILEWKKHLAYFYLIGGAPLIYIGWKSLK